jgi:hypothetical protein
MRRIRLHSHDRPDIVDIGLGLSEAAEGLSIRSWFQWDEKGVHSSEHAMDETLLKMVIASYHELKTKASFEV